MKVAAISLMPLLVGCAVAGVRGQAPASLPSIEVHTRALRALEGGTVREPARVPGHRDQVVGVEHQHDVVGLEEGHEVPDQLSVARQVRAADAEVEGLDAHAPLLQRLAEDRR